MKIIKGILRAALTLYVAYWFWVLVVAMCLPGGREALRGAIYVQSQALMGALNVGK